MLYCRTIRIAVPHLRDNFIIAKVGKPHRRDRLTPAPPQPLSPPLRSPT